MSQTYTGAKGRNKKSDPFLQIPKEVLHSKQYAALNGWDTKLILDLGAAYNGKNNGDLSACWKFMSEKGWNSKGTLAASIKSVVASGFVIVTRQGGRNTPTLYALTFHDIHECKGKHDVKPQKAPKTWKNIEPIKRKKKASAGKKY